MPFEHDYRDSVPENNTRKEIDAPLVREFLDYDPLTGALSWKARDLRWFQSERVGKGWNAKHAGRRADGATTGAGYASVCIFNRRFLAHRIAWAHYYGENPPEVLDHINGARRDNRIENLRSVDWQGNAKNLSVSSNNKTGISGIQDQNPKAWGSRWRVVRSAGGRIIGVKSFHCIGQAVRYRNSDLRERGFTPLHGIRLTRADNPSNCDTWQSIGALARILAEKAGGAQ